MTETRVINTNNQVNPPTLTKEQEKWVDENLPKVPHPTEDICDEFKHPTELRFPIQTEAFRELIEKMYRIHLEKNQDYSPANILVTGEVGVLVRVWDKLARIFNLNGLMFPSVKPEIEQLIEDIETNSPKVDDTRMILERLDEIVKKSSLDFSKAKKKEASNESLEDSWLDLAVYAIIGYLENKRKWGK